MSVHLRWVVSSRLNVFLQAVVDIMEKQGGFVADRPRMVAGGEIFSGGLSVFFAPVGDRFRRMRKFVVQGTMQVAPNLHFQRDAEHFMRISSLKQPRDINPCRCHMRQPPSSAFSTIHAISTTM
jgi:hypothetical protein